MNKQTNTGLPVWFWLISGAALLWNLLGVMAYLGQTMMTPEDIAKLAPDKQALYSNTPAWATAAFATAVFGGALGCALLLLRKTLARPVLIISMIGITVQMIYNFFISKAFDIYGPGEAVMPVMIITIGAGLVVLSTRAQSNGWLT